MRTSTGEVVRTHLGRAVRRSADPPLRCRGSRHQLQRRLSLLVSVISLAAVAWWISKQDAPQFPESAEGWAWLLVAVCVYGVALAVRGFRWHRILRLIHIPHKRADAYRLVLVGYMGNNVLPVRGGEILRIGLLGARTTARRREILSSVVAERLLDAAVLAALFAILTWFNVADAPPGRRRPRSPPSRSCSARSRSPPTWRCAAAASSTRSTRRSGRS